MRWPWVAQAFRLASVGVWHPHEFQARRDRLRQGKASLAQQLERLTEAYLGSIIPLPEYERRRAEIMSRDASLAEQESRPSGESDRLKETLGLAASLEAFCERVSTGLETATIDQKRQLVEILIDRVVETGDEVEIRYAFPTSLPSEHDRFCHLRSDYYHHPTPRHPAGLLGAGGQGQRHQPVGPPYNDIASVAGEVGQPRTKRDALQVDLAHDSESHRQGMREIGH